MSYDTTSQPVLAASVTDTDSTGAHRTPNLDYVFDDPAHGEPGRDRMLIHGLWELVLLLAVAGFGYLLYREDSAAFSGAGLRELLLSAGVLGAVAAASAISLRAGAPNLAVGAVAVAAGIYFGRTSDGGLLQPALIVVAICAAIGVVQGLIIAGLHVPGWAVSLVAALLLLAWASTRTSVSAQANLYDPTPHAYYWFGAFAALSVIASVVGLVPTVRRGFGRFRPVADPAHRRGWIAAIIVLVATLAATILSGLGGVLMVSLSATAVPEEGLMLTGLALGAALLGGTSAYGRRGGIFGTVLAVVLITLIARYSAVADLKWSPLVLAAAAIAVGLLVTRLVERLGRPRPARESLDEDWVPVAPATETRSWSTTSASTTSGGLWASDDAWGTADRR
jgi:ribose/xylose/arabinose/galactoside ABC-type transport system permease subunit